MKKIQEIRDNLIFDEILKHLDYMPPSRETLVKKIHKTRIDDMRNIRITDPFLLELLTEKK